MWPTGTTIHNPVTHEWARVLVSAEDSGGAYLKAELLAQPTAHPGGPHRHPRQEEKFEVITGELSYRLGQSTGVAGPGDEIIVPAGTDHDWWNAGDSVCTAHVTVTPPGRFQEMIGAVWGLAIQGRTNDYGAPKPLDGILLAEAFADEAVFLSPPPAVQKLMARVAAPLIRATGRSVDDPELIEASLVDPESWPASQSGG